uniref:Lipase_3 domain-containing protein n=1 Tax=Syphacia muris TaxID=451379 RepID=A0A0N5ASJ4_9BILA
MLPLVLVAVIAIGYTNAGSVPLCKEIKDCATCAKSHIYVFGFKEHCRWCLETNTCGGPFACSKSASVVQREPFKCPTDVPTIKGRRYTDKLGRSLYALALASKSPDPKQCLTNTRPDVKILKQYEVECDASHNKCAGMLAVSEAAKSLYIVYRTTKEIKQLLTELVHTIVAQLGAWEKFEAGGGVITYFHSAFEKLFKEGGMRSELLKMKEKYPGYKVWVTGHSLGGSLASITALYLANKTVFPADRIRLVTFGEPRTGNLAFAKAVEDSLKFRFRVVHRDDVITNIPAAMDPNSMLITASIAERQPHFYRYLVHYNNDMKPEDDFTVCRYSEDHVCRNLATATNAMDHVSYFGINSDDFIKDNCTASLLA